MPEFDYPENDHLHDIIVEAIERFAQEDGCTPAVWAGRAVRSTAVSRLTMEACADGREHLSAQRTRIRGVPCKHKGHWNCGAGQ